jgi:hypothetical protein
VNLRQVHLSVQLLHVLRTHCEAGHDDAICWVSTGDLLMLVFGRKILEAVRIGEDVTVTVLHVRGD